MLRKTLMAIVGTSFLLSVDLQAEKTSSEKPQKQKICPECPQTFWVDAEYLYWKIQDPSKVVPLVVRGPVVPDGSPVLNQPGTKVILGGKKTDIDWRSGGRFALGYWFSDKHCLGLEANYFFLPTTSKNKRVSSSGSIGSPFLTIPFFDVTTGQESSVTIADPGSFANKSSLKISNNMQGAELNALTTLSHSCNLNADLLGGFRYWNFVEHLSFNTSSPYVPPNPTDIFKTQDKFRVKNNFYGGQIGIKFDYIHKWFFFNLKGKVALGAMCEASDIRGHLSSNDFDGFTTPLTYPGGYFALPTNIGDHKRTRFSVIPEVNVDLGYQVVDCFRFQVGYTFLYATNVLRATKQVNRHINPTQSAIIEFIPDPVLVGKASPKASMKSVGLWTQGINIGFEYRY